MHSVTPNHYSEPTCYIVLETLFIEAPLFNIPSSIGAGILMVRCKRGDLHDPNATPLLECYNAGTRQFLYNDAWWSEYDVDWRHIKDTALRLYLDAKISEEFRNKISDYMDQIRSPYNSRGGAPLYILGQDEPIYVPGRTYSGPTLVIAMYRVSK